MGIGPNCKVERIRCGTVLHRATCGLQQATSVLIYNRVSVPDVPLSTGTAQMEGGSGARLTGWASSRLSCQSCNSFTSVTTYNRPPSFRMYPNSLNELRLMHRRLWFLACNNLSPVTPLPSLSRHSTMHLKYKTKQGAYG